MVFMSNLRRGALAISAIAATAALAWFGTGLNPAWPLLWFAPLPVLLYSNRADWRSSAVVAFAGWLVGDLNLWVYLRIDIGMPLGPVFIVVVGFALVFAAVVLLYRALLRRGRAWIAVIAFPSAWVSFEYLLNLTWQNGTAANISYTQLGFLPFLQLASITGPWGMSFLLFLFPAALAVGFHLRRARPKVAIRIVGGALGVIVTVLIFGTVRLALPQKSPMVRVGLVVSDAPGYRYMAAPGAPAMRLFQGYAGQVTTLAARGAKVVVLPETVAVVNRATRPAVDALFQSLSDRTRAVVVVGVDYMGAKRIQYNQARIYTPGGLVRTYEKHHLLLPGGARFTPGTQLLSFARPSGLWGVMICKDMDFTQLSRRYGRLGAGLMLAPAADFDVDRAFHGHMAIMRGVESGFAVARSARRGYLTVSDDRGRILGQARSDSAPFATVLVNVPVAHNATVFLALGDWFAWVALVILAFALTSLLNLPVGGIRRVIASCGSNERAGLRHGEWSGGEQA